MTLNYFYLIITISYYPASSRLEINCYHREAKYQSANLSSKIELDRLNRSRFQCNLCGNKIDRMLTIIQKIYLEVKFNMNMPLICCNCYLSLEENKFIENNRRRILESLSFYTPSIFLIINPYPFNLISTFIYILFVIVLKVIIKQKFHYSLFLLDLIKGKKFYEKYFRDKNKLDSP